jgi:hypothetical protein
MVSGVVQAVMSAYGDNAYFERVGSPLAWC